MADTESLDDFKSRIVVQMAMFDPSDAYNGEADYDAESYYAAIDRVTQLVEGKINAWTDLNPEAQS